MSEKKQHVNGKPGLMLGARPSKIELIKPSKELQKLLTSAYNQLQRLDDPLVNSQTRKDFVFHMTDWLADLHRLAAIYEHPGQEDRKQAGRDIAGFLYHVIPHLMEAGRLMLDYEPGYIFDSPKPKKAAEKPLRRARRSRRPAPSP